MNDNITTLPLSEKEIERGQDLVDAITEAIDEFSRTQPLSNIVVLGALEIVRYNYLNDSAE